MEIGMRTNANSVQSALGGSPVRDVNICRVCAYQADSMISSLGFYVEHCPSCRIILFTRVGRVKWHAIFFISYQGTP